ncbi:MAG TPA: PEP-CTERM sorting domain-containing protein [Chthoniobacteraceae bacterium]|nr:PEP-CTERM sorting domain-containing protein [Chthoniobacteraceae bacterium]
MKTKLCLLFTLALVISMGSLRAQTTLFTDSFETPVLTTDDTFTNGTITNWTKTGGAGAFGVERLATTHFSGTYPRATDGNQVGYSNGGSQQFKESLTGSNSTLADNTTYTLSIDIGDRNDLNFTGYVIQLFAGSTQVAIDNDTQAVPDGGWKTATITYTSSASDPLAGQTLSMEFQSLTPVQQGSETGGQTLFDNVKLIATPIPEPSTSALLVMAGAGLLLAVRRRKKSAGIAGWRQSS